MYLENHPFSNGAWVSLDERTQKPELWTSDGEYDHSIELPSPEGKDEILRDILPELVEYHVHNEYIDIIQFFPQGWLEAFGEELQKVVEEVIQQ
jgi:hypothetical protein